MPKAVEDIEKLIRERLKLWSDPAHNNQEHLGTKAVKAELRELLKAFEQEKCVLCGHQDCPGDHVALCQPIKAIVCGDAYRCQARLVSKFIDQLKQGAR
jgi:hypothetical protein